MAAATPKIPQPIVPQGAQPNFPSSHQPNNTNKPTVAAKTAPRFKYSQPPFSRFCSFSGPFSVAGPSCSANRSGSVCLYPPAHPSDQTGSESVSFLRKPLPPTLNRKRSAPAYTFYKVHCSSPQGRSLSWRRELYSLVPRMCQANEVFLRLPGPKRLPKVFVTSAGSLKARCKPLMSIPRGT